jgi:hypothetical protein
MNTPMIDENDETENKELTQNQIIALMWQRISELEQRARYATEGANSRADMERASELQYMIRVISGQAT